MPSRTCVLIEDSKTQALILSKQICQMGWNGTICRSVEELDRQVWDSVPDMLLMDLYLEKGESIEHLPKLRDRWPNVPVTVMTAGASETEVFDCLQRAKAAGADFVIRKPFDATALGDLLQDAERIVEGGSRRRHVLVTDDSATVLKIVRRCLSSDSIRVSTATTMEDTLDRLTYDMVDLVVADIFMPGIGGIEGIMRIRKSWPDLKVLAMSGGYEASGTQTDALKAAEKIGADGVIRKPFSPEDIQARVEDLLGGGVEHEACLAG